MATAVIKWKLNEMLAAQRKTSRELAEFLQVHENSVYRLRKQDRMPRLEHDTLEGICKFLECKPGDLLEMVEDEPPHANAKRSKAKTMQREAIATVAADEPSFNPGDCCKIPNGSRVFVDRYLGNRRYAVTWEAGGIEDEFPEHLLEFICHAK